MDPRSKLLSAIALATITASVVRPADAQPATRPVLEDLYQQCLDTSLPAEDRATACSCFVDTFPDSDLVPSVLSASVGLGRFEEIWDGSSDGGTCGGGYASRFIDDDVQVAIY